MMNDKRITAMAYIIVLMCSLTLDVLAVETNSMGYLAQEVKYYGHLIYNSKTNSYVVRLRSPLNYLASLSLAKKVDAFVEQAVTNASTSLIISAFDPHELSYRIEVFVQDHENSRSTWKYQKIEVNVPDGPVLLSLKREVPSWPMALLLPRLEKVSGVFFPELGEGMMSIFVTTNINGESFRCASLIGMSSETLDSGGGGISLLGLIILGLEAEANPIENASARQGGQP